MSEREAEREIRLHPEQLRLLELQMEKNIRDGVQEGVEREIGRIEGQRKKIYGVIAAAALFVIAAFGYASVQHFIPSIVRQLMADPASGELAEVFNEAQERSARVEELVERAETQIRTTEARLKDAQSFTTQTNSLLDKASNEVKQLETLQLQLRKEQQRLLTSMNLLRKESTQELARLKVEVDYQRELRQIQRFKNSALDGSYEAYAKLLNYPTKNEGLQAAVRAAFFETKSFYINIDRVKGISIWVINPDGTKGLQNEKMPTQALIQTFLADNNWPFRAKAAQFLRNRRELGVPEALLRGILGDKNLYVRREGLRAFVSVTRFPQQDVFDFERADDWWKQNKEKYINEVKKPGTQD